MKSAQVRIVTDEGDDLFISVDGVGNVSCNKDITHEQARALGDLLPKLARIANDHVKQGTFHFVGTVERLVPGGLHKK